VEDTASTFLFNKHFVLLNLRNNVTGLDGDAQGRDEPLTC
jgi:hypothetical protein